MNDVQLAEVHRPAVGFPVLPRMMASGCSYLAALTVKYVLLERLARVFFRHFPILRVLLFCV